jgi:DNA-cytosine methyltransferase
MSTIAEILPVLTRDMKQFETSINALHRKQTGSYYTSIDLSIVMMDELINTLPKSKRESLYSLRFLEPCVGTGSFVFAYLIIAKKLGFSKKQYVALLNNIYVCDINATAIKQYKKSLKTLAKNLFDINLDDHYFDTHTGKALLFDVNSELPRYISINEIFGRDAENSFDIVATNPPYKNLKAENSCYTDTNVLEMDKMRYKLIAKSASQNMRYSTVGVLNLYKIFVEEIIERYAAKNGHVSLLIPSSLLTDKTCEKLRTRILESCSIKSIRTIQETNHFIDARQAICTLLLEKGSTSGEIDITTDYSSSNENTISAKASDVISNDFGNAIVALTGNDLEKFRMMNNYPKIKDLDYIVNMRGELDLTANKKFITQNETHYPLLRGRNIGYYTIENTPGTEYVKDEFVNLSAKNPHIGRRRIICQQISNMAKERRLVFAIASPNMVLGNSCNFIKVNNNNYGIDLMFLLGVLNSSVMNWYFKLQSSNNHINNYEIDNFPIPVNCKQKKDIASTVECYLSDPKRKELLNRIDELVRQAFFGENIKPQTDFDKRVEKMSEEKHWKLSRNQILNHTTFKLSELDLEMIKSVPQGGSWKDIPQSTVQKSKRLIRINETGGRTTLYGRIDYSKPSYTITTYFNRPGNGTYVHPIHDRVLSVREAARFQSFPDSYYFCGNKTQLLNQVGNAVPPLLAYQLARQIVQVTGCKTSLDLFCGAGGMTYGFKLAGIKSILANDIDEAACLTLKVNNPEIDILCGDITTPQTKNKLIDASLNRKVDIICGGPPCQGFSMAGFRLDDDPRNQLFKDFINIVDNVHPKIIVFENVEGLLTFQEGKIYKSIHKMFGDLGYNTEGRVLLSSLYGVPQKRKRVIIICTQKSLNFMPEDLYPAEITTTESSHISAYAAIGDLEKVACGENSVRLINPYSPFTEWSMGKISATKYIEIIRQRNIIEGKNITSTLKFHKKHTQDSHNKLNLFDLESVC